MRYLKILVMFFACISYGQSLHIGTNKKDNMKRIKVVLPENYTLKMYKNDVLFKELCFLGTKIFEAENKGLTRIFAKNRKKKRIFEVHFNDEKQRNIEDLSREYLEEFN